MPTAAPSPVPVVSVGSAQPQATIEGALLIRLVALNSTDPQIVALLAQWQQLMGKAFGT